MEVRKLLSYYKENTIEAGCDEAGRGCLAGPVFAAAVILPSHFNNNLLNDSKLLTKKQRAELRPVIEKEALAWAVEMVDNLEIDQVNILNASFLAMNRAVGKLKIKPQHLLIDGNRFRAQNKIPYTCMVKGDGRFFSIAAASVLAKTYRDDFMLKLHEEFPNYMWHQNKGYATLRHRTAIRDYGVSKYHRKSFRLFDEQLKLEFKA
ncbi:MAG TPA: ribonuclease HII [Prolixibacteraceae bacterium]|nr:ribonuclease HII [Prolixibacteraceae bacterium]